MKSVGIGILEGSVPFLSSLKMCPRILVWEESSCSSPPASLLMVSSTMRARRGQGRQSSQERRGEGFRTLLLAYRTRDGTSPQSAWLTANRRNPTACTHEHKIELCLERRRVFRNPGGALSMWHAEPGLWAHAWCTVYVAR